MPTTDRLSLAFAALGDPIRRDIVARLSEGDATLVERVAYDVSMQAVSKHLRVLEEAGIVSRHKDAQRRPAHLEIPVFDLLGSWLERYRRQAEERYRRLDDVLATMHEPAHATPPRPPDPATPPATRRPR